MQGKVSIFSTGKMVAIGSKSEEAARRDLLHVTQSMGISKGPMKIEVRNIVATVDLARAIDLEALLDVVPGIIYEPEQFPGAIFRPELHHVTVLIFGSGKMVMAGLKSESGIENVVKEVIDPLGL